MAKINQTVGFGLSQPATTWRQDSSLFAPILRFPLDETRFCPQIYMLKGQSAGLTLYWKSVVGATFYVVQISDNQSFHGPNIRAEKTTNLYFDLEYINQLRVGDHFFWRVFAYNATGGCSTASEARSVHVACPSMKGINVSADTTNYADVSAPQICDNAGVSIEIGGPLWVRKSDSDRTWALNVNYDCESFEGHVVSISDVVWEIRQSSLNPVTITEEDNYHLKVDVDSTREEWFDITAHVIFNLYGVGDFQCDKHKKVLIEGIVSSGGVINFTVLNWFPAADPDTFACDCVLAVVTRTSCSSAAQVGDEVLVCDPDLCWFNLPIELLVGSRGRADWMAIDGVTETLECPTLLYQFGITSCLWLVSQLCCREEVYV